MRPDPIGGSRDHRPTAPTSASPFLRWPGGKRLLARQMMADVPTSYGTYYEPFLGGAALFLSLRPKKAVLSDTNSELINCYRQVKKCPEELIGRLSEMTNSESEYLRIRADSPSSDLARAARLIYLSNLSFNGIYRVNFEGRFNVPYGHRPHRRAAPPDALRNAHRSLASARLRASDFDVVLNSAAPGDLIYLDPPYSVAHDNNGFVRYNARLFSWSDQERLALTAKRLGDLGCHVMVTNANHESVRALYPGFTAKPLHRASTIAARVEDRGPVTELLLTTGPDRAR